MFIFVLLFIGFCVWVSIPEKKQDTKSVSSVVKTTTIKTTTKPRTVHTSNYSRPRSTIAVSPQKTASQQKVSIKSSEVKRPSSITTQKAVYIPRTTPSYTTINTISRTSSIEDPILSKPAVTVVGSTISKPKSDVKSEHQEILRILKENGVVYLYHFTDRRNLESIRKHGGLFSWQTCLNKGINIPYAGGDGSSRLLDRRHGLQDYVRLSLCNDHPMMWRLKQMGYDLVLLKIKVDAAVLRDTLFSDMNATDNQHSHGGSLQDLKKIKFSATKRRYVSRDDADFKYHQAEVMVKTFIPAEYIVNLDYPQAA